MEKNPGARTISKLCLNTLWGKFGQRDNLHKTVYVHDLDTWLDLAKKPSVDIHTVHPVNDGESIMVAYDIRDDFLDLVEDNLCTSVIVAAWTTWLARKKLYMDVLNKLKERVCYFDTDSVIYEIHRGDDPTLVQTGPYFGDLTDEIDHGCHMTEFVSAGPKNYGYTTSAGKSTVKVRGITMTTRVSKQINMTSMQSTIDHVVSDVMQGQASVQEAADIHSIVVAYPHSIVREGKITNRVLAKDLTKKYKAVIGKRMMVASLIHRGDIPHSHAKEFETLPFGTCCPNL